MTVPNNDPIHSSTQAAPPHSTTSSPSSAGPAPTPHSHSSASSSSSPPGTDRERNYQRAFLLQQVHSAPDQQLAKGKANRFPRAVTRELGLTPTIANTLRDELVQEGHLRTLKKSGSIVYELTIPGKTLLEKLEQKPVPEGRKPAREGPVSAEVQLARKTFLLFQLFEADGLRMEQKAANRFREPGRKFLDLKASTANRLRKEMADQGLIELTRQGRNATYKLTQPGIEFLGVRSSFPETEFALNGRVLNELLEAARESARQFQPNVSETTQSPEEVLEPVGQS